MKLAFFKDNSSGGLLSRNLAKNKIGLNYLSLFRELCFFLKTAKHRLFRVCGKPQVCTKTPSGKNKKKEGKGSRGPAVWEPLHNTTPDKLTKHIKQHHKEVTIKINHLGAGEIAQFTA